MGTETVVAADDLAIRLAIDLGRDPVAPSASATKDLVRKYVEVPATEALKQPKVAPNRPRDVNATVMPWSLPPCDEPAPFQRDDRLVWYVSCAVKRELGTGGDGRLVRLASELGAWEVLQRAECAAGFTKGFGTAVYQGVRRAATDLGDLAAGVLKTIGSAAGTVYDPRVWVDIRLIMNAEPGSRELAAAIEELRRYIGAEHEDFMEAIVMGCMVIAAMRGLDKWVETNPEAGYTILVALAKSLGKLIGEVASELSQATTPFEVGSVLGDLCGSVLVEGVRFYYGF